MQTCEAGEHAWIDEWDGAGEEPDSSAPSVLVTAAVADGADHGAPEDEAATATTELAAEVTTASAEGDGDGTGLAVVGLVVGALGLVVGGVALASSRRPS